MYRQGQSQCWEMEEIKEHEKRNGCMSMLGKGSRKGCPQEHYHWCLHLQVLDSYQKQPTDLDWYASPTLGHCTLQLLLLVLRSFLFHPLLPIQRGQSRFSYSGITFSSATPSQAQLGCLPVPLFSTTQPSAQLNFNTDTLSLELASRLCFLLFY